jgi:hypothetical protein
MSDIPQRLDQNVETPSQDRAPQQSRAESSGLKAEDRSYLERTARSAWTGSLNDLANAVKRLNARITSRGIRLALLVDDCERGRISQVKVATRPPNDLDLRIVLGADGVLKCSTGEQFSVFDADLDFWEAKLLAWFDPT